MEGDQLPPKAALPQAWHAAPHSPRQSSAVRLKLLVPLKPNSSRHIQPKTLQPSTLCICRHLPPKQAEQHAHAAGCEGARLWLLFFHQHGDEYSAGTIPSLPSQLVWEDNKQKKKEKKNTHKKHF